MTTSGLANNDVCAVIVTYHPQPAALLRLLDALLPQVSEVVVVDNGSSLDVTQLLVVRPVTVLSFDENLGVAAGFNRGIAWACERGYGHLLLLDQDSVPAPGMVACLYDALIRLVGRGTLVAAVGPAAFDPSTGRKAGFARTGLIRFRYIEPASGDETVFADFIISSGSLIPMTTLRRIGWMDEGLFIDLVDTEWFLRAAASGLLAYGVPSALLYHGIGDSTKQLQVGGMKVGSLHQHEPLRHYYIFRNSILLSRRAYVPWRWVLNNTVQLLGMLFYFSLFTQQRLAHLRMMLLGVWDGLKGRTGGAV